MAALTLTDVRLTEFAGDTKVKIYTTSTPTTATETADVSADFDTVYFAQAIVEAGSDAALLPAVQTSFSGTTVTVATFEQDGTVATDWTGATLRLLVIGDS